MGREIEPSSYLMDTSALLALMEDEPEAAQVEELLRQERVLIPWVVLLEIHYVTTRRLGLAEADQRYGLVEKSGAKVLWDNDERLVLQASRLKAQYRLSLADCLVAAHTLRHGSVLVHRDPEYGQLESELDQLDLAS